jgi:hypothetical protein
MLVYLNRKVFAGKYEESLWTIFIGLTMGILTISFIIWNRLIRERLPREIVGEPFTFQFWIILYLFLYFLFIVLYKLNKLQKKLRGIPLNPRYVRRFTEFLEKKPILQDALQFTINYILSGPVYLWTFFYFNFPSKYKTPVLNYFYNVGRLICERVFPGSITGYFRETLATMILLYIPKIIVFGVYLYEIFIYKELEWFYYCAIILLIPLIFLGLRRILLDLSYFELERLEKDLFKIKIVYENQKEYDFRKAIESDLSGEPSDEKYEFTRTNNDISDEVYQHAIHSYCYLWEIQRMAVKFYKTSEKYDDIASLLVNMILMLSFFLWLLIIFGII